MDYDPISHRANYNNPDEALASSQGGDQETFGPHGAFLTLRSARREMSRQDERRGMRLRAPPAPA